LLKKREGDKKELEEHIKSDIEQFIFPYLEKLKAKCSKDSDLAFLNIIQLNLDEITSSFTRNQNDLLTKLTPAQIQIANLIKQGHTTKEIAALLCLSPATVACHRQEIRKRLSLTNKKRNLQAILAPH
jgi:DNA-binding NarL/FixJ family response regulator